MASPAAQTYFGSFSPEDQQAIKASWGGADLMDRWFNNAVAAGAVSPQGGTTVDRQVANANTAYASGERGTTAASPSGYPTVAQLRAQSAGKSEDYARYSDATLQGWINGYWDPQKGGFRSMRGASGVFDKPTECPPGQGPQGGDESSPCGSAGYSTPAAGGGGASNASPTGAANAAPGSEAGAGYTGQDDPLQRMIQDQLSAGNSGVFKGANAGGAFGQGGVFSSGQGVSALSAPTPTPAVVGSSLAGLVAQSFPAQPAAAPVASPVSTVAPQAAPVTPAPQPRVAMPETAGVGIQPPVARSQYAPTTQPQLQSAPVANPFGATQQGAGTLEDLINPTRRRSRDARMGGTWF